MFETKSGVLLIAGLGFFGLAFFSNGVVPMLMYSKDRPEFRERTAEEEVNRFVVYQFDELSQKYAEQFQKNFHRDVAEIVKNNQASYAGLTDPRPENTRAYFERLSLEHQQALCGKVLREGRKIYVGEGCWHCHSQFVRPVSGEEKRWGPVSKSWEYQNELQRPVMFGTRRVGPDLSREGGRRSNDWHAVHFFKPRMTSPQSIMPEYPWFFDNDEEGKPSPGMPNRRGMALIVYIQWLGSWLDSYPHYNLFKEESGER
jgi:hypothetical protein